MPGGEMTDPGILPMTAAQQASLATKLSLIKQLSSRLAPASVPSSLVLAQHARHQYHDYWCGPAAIQEIANYSANVTSIDTSRDGGQGPNNFLSQYAIDSVWTHATPDGGTTAANFLAGLNGAPNLPSGFQYVQWHQPDWASFHVSIETDTYYWDLGIAAGVNPRATNSSYYLFSWRNAPPSNLYAHYIAIRGYSGDNAHQTTSKAYYNDSSGGTDHYGNPMDGSTGDFSDLSYTVYKTMMNRFGNEYW